MKTFTSLLLLALSSAALAQTPLDPKFFANPEFLVRFPGATVLHPDSFAFVEAQATRTLREGDALIERIRAEPNLLVQIQTFPTLTASDRRQVMQKLFDLEVELSGVEAPRLILDDQARRSAFFDFDPQQPGSGTVILNPTQLFADVNPYAALLLLVHETRHSAQFQAIQEPAYRTSFAAQRLLFDQRLPASFCDFLTLNHEYEAFLFGNYVLEVLTGGQVDTSDMGTLASQYIPGLGFRLDLAELIRKTPTVAAVLPAFNELERAQHAGAP